MNFRQIEAFNSVMLSGSTVRAAELMQVTQPAVSRSIADLEASIGFSLFDRVRGRLVPTPEGQMFFREVADSFKGMDRLRSAAASIRDYGSGSLRVASLSSLGTLFVPKAIQAFRKDNPQIRLNFQIMSSSHVRNQIAEGQFDMGLAADEIDRSGVETRLFANYPAYVAMAPDHPLARVTTIGPKDLEKWPMIGLSSEDRARHRFETIMRDAGCTTNYIIETSSSSTICALASVGDAVGLVNPVSYEMFLNTGLILRPFSPKVMFRSLLIYRPDVQRARLVRDFTAILFQLRNQMSFKTE